MENLILAFNVVAPLMLLMLVGYFVRAVKLVDADTMLKMNRIVFKVFLPVMLFNNIINTDLSTSVNWPLMITAMVFIVLEFGLAMLIVPFIEKEPPRRGVLAQVAFRANFVIFGLPVITSLNGADSNLGMVSLVMACATPVFNVMAVLALEFHRGGKLDVKRMLIGIVKNPLIIASVAGILFLVSGLKLPNVLAQTVSDIGKISTPLALFILGAGFEFKSVKKCVKQLIIGVTSRLVIVPIIFLTLAILLGFRGEELAVLMVMLGAPPAVSSYTMAQQMDGDADLAASLVVFGSLFAVFTMFCWIFLLKTIGFI